MNHHGNLTSIICINVGDNQLGGTIPWNAWNFPFLENFSVGDNSFSGTIPPSFLIDYPLLRNLRLNDNNFSGPPAQLHA